MNTLRKVTLYIAASLDGYIAKPNDDLSFLSIVEQEGEDYGYGEFIHSVDTVILGRKTYDWVLANAPAFSHASRETYVLTRSARPAIGKTSFYSGNVRELVERLKAGPGKTIFVDGGADTVHTMLKDGLIDEIIVSIIPIMVGGGVRLFKEGFPETRLTLLSVKPFQTGLVQLHYACQVQ